MRPAHGERYCAVHNEAAEEDRVACPADPRHTVKRSDVERHVKICTATKQQVEQEAQDYFKEKANDDRATDSESDETEVVEDDAAAGFALFSDDDDDDLSRFDEDPAADDEENSLATRAERHVRQGAKIASLLEKSITQCLRDDGKGPPQRETALMIVDLGGGRGGLAASCRERFPGAALRVVDREARRYKFDHALRGGGDFERIRCDLLHLNLRKVGEDCDLAGVAKHLCGAATDMALRALVDDPRTKYVAIATCCHHRCDWDKYVGRDYLRDHNRGRQQFQAMAKLSSWFSAPGFSEEDTTAEATHTRRKKQILGRRCKRFIDAGRVHYLKRHGFQAKQITYCHTSLSPENVIIIATREPQK